MESEALLPRDKHDLERVEALIAAGPHAAVPLLDELLPWLQDINWPVAAPLAEFLVEVGAPLVPHLKRVLASGDDMWIYWVLQYVVAELPPELVRELAPELRSLATAAENDLVALRIGTAAGVWDERVLRALIENMLRAHEEIVAELTELRAWLPMPPNPPRNAVEDPS